MWNPFNRNTISNSSASKRSLQLITQKGMPFAYVEAYKALRTNLNFLSGSGDVHAFVVTSTVPEEAKSNVSVNLALGEISVRKLTEMRQPARSDDLEIHGKVFIGMDGKILNIKVEVI